jgi:hypothetical protein
VHSEAAAPQTGPPIEHEFVFIAVTIFFVVAIPQQS